MSNQPSHISVEQSCKCGASYRVSIAPRSEPGVGFTAPVEDREARRAVDMWWSEHREWCEGGAEWRAWWRHSAARIDGTSPRPWAECGVVDAWFAKQGAADGLAT